MKLTNEIILKTLDEPRIVFGSFARFAKKIGVSRQVVFNWRKNGIPAESVDKVNAHIKS